MAIASCKNANPLSLFRFDSYTCEIGLGQYLGKWEEMGKAGYRSLDRTAESTYKKS